MNKDAVLTKRAFAWFEASVKYVRAGCYVPYGTMIRDSFTSVYDLWLYR